MTVHQLHPQPEQHVVTGPGFTPLERAEMLQVFLTVEIHNGWEVVADHGIAAILDMPPRRKVVWVDQLGHLQHQWAGIT